MNADSRSRLDATNIAMRAWIITGRVAILGPRMVRGFGDQRPIVNGGVGRHP
jgi:hypothetical protein